ncbi:TetR family transcriptional regulator [Streptomyces sp. Je 1-79]|uniref:ScbR family autoregulator-binding transcription factor n=1 Tax=Streptomyces sp. Je 1-79 TaxID=2943847 RepID=UPI0021A78CE6|nr:ScbR family autoregulator-binding transcription factor [Streptomyces sp. Je 1-79]MCT4356214.1 TetR family transcriptional regulator [Streptomyces sp. Je 1-79]
MVRVRQERAEATRQAILDGAATAFDSAGFGSTSLTDIVRHAGVTKGALYFHFQSKESLAEALVEEQFLAVNPPSTTVLGVQSLIDRSHQLAEELRVNVRVRAGVRLILERGLLGDADPAAYNEWSEQLREALAFAQGRGDVRPEVNVADVAVYVVGAFTGIQITSHVRTGRADLHDRLADLWRLLLPTIVPARRLHRFDPEGSEELRAGFAAIAD